MLEYTPIIVFILKVWVMPATQYPEAFYTKDLCTQAAVVVAKTYQKENLSIPSMDCVPELIWRRCPSC